MAIEGIIHGMISFDFCLVFNNKLYKPLEGVAGGKASHQTELNTTFQQWCTILHLASHKCIFSPSTQLRTAPNTSQGYYCTWVIERKQHSF